MTRLFIYFAFCIFTLSYAQTSLLIFYSIFKTTVGFIRNELSDQTWSQLPSASYLSSIITIWSISNLFFQINNRQETHKSSHSESTSLFVTFPPYSSMPSDENWRPQMPTSQIPQLFPGALTWAPKKKPLDIPWLSVSPYSYLSSGLRPIRWWATADTLAALCTSLLQCTASSRMGCFALVKSHRQFDA